MIDVDCYGLRNSTTKIYALVERASNMIKEKWGLKK